MMLTITEFIAFLRIKFPTVVFFNSTIDPSNPKCIGVYARTASNRIEPLGGPANGSYNVLSISIVVHWTEDASQCEDMANSLYSGLQVILKEQTPDGTTISFIQLQDANPVWVGRTDKNVAEKVIRANIIYERGA